jgi:hypothetical protein
MTTCGLRCTAEPGKRLQGLRRADLQPLASLWSPQGHLERRRGSFFDQRRGVDCTSELWWEADVPQQLLRFPLWLRELMLIEGLDGRPFRPLIPN